MMEPNNHTRKKVVIAIVSIVAVAVVVGAYVLFRAYYTPMPAYSNRYDAAKIGFIAGNYDEAITNFADLVRTAPNADLQGKNKLLLASSYLHRNQVGDEAKAMNLYKDVIGDYTVSPSVRSLALNSVALIVRRNNLAFYQLYFPEDPYKSFIPAMGTESSKISQVYLKLLQLSDTTSPNSYAEYVIAGSYYASVIGQALAADTPSTDPDLRSVALEAQKYVREGDKKSDAGTYLHNLLLAAYLSRATAISASEGVLQTMPIAEREEAYKKVLTFFADSLSDAEQADPGVVLTLMRTRFFYADFLMRYVGPSRDSDIRELLKPYGTITQKNILPHTDYITTDAEKLAAISPEFKAYWESNTLP